MIKTIFDLGMCDAADTEYYLEEGFKVVALEANPALAERARRQLKSFVESGQLKVVHAALSPSNDPVTLTVCGDDLGSSSIYEGNVSDRTPMGTYTVPGITASQLFEEHGVPHYLKIDLEGADRLGVLGLTEGAKPEFLSFEMGGDFEELFAHVCEIGFSRFKIIDQTTFRELQNEGSLRDRIARGLIRRLGYAEPAYVKRNGRFFRMGRSSGPVPWASDGQWQSKDKLMANWKAAAAQKRRNVWFDLHAN